MGITGCSLNALVTFVSSPLTVRKNALPRKDQKLRLLLYPLLPAKRLVACPVPQNKTNDRGDARYNSSQAFSVSSYQLYLLALVLSGRLSCSF